MIKILHIVSSLNINSGMMSVIMNYYRSIDRNEIQFDFWFFEEMKETHHAEIEKLGGKVYFMPYRNFKPGDQHEIRRFFLEHRGEYVAVHCHPIWASFIVAREAKRSGIRHVIQHVHSTKYSEKKKSAIRNFFLMKFIRLFATDFIACNAEARYLFGKRLAEGGKVFVLPNAIDVDKYRYDTDRRGRIREELGIPADSLVIGTVGRLAPEKNQLFMVEIFTELLRLHLDSRMIIVGEGKMRQAIEQRIAEAELRDKVILTGKRRDVQALLSAFDLFVMTSLFEGTPVSALEARSAGLPCLLSDSITKSIDMPGIIYYPLECSASSWAETVWETAKQHEEADRDDGFVVRQHGFDIQTEAGVLQKFYLGLR